MGTLTRSDRHALGSAVAIERALSRFGWLGDADEVLAKLGIDRTKLRAIEADDEVSAAIETRRDAALNTPWRIEHEQSRARRFFEDAAAHAVPGILRAAWGAVLYGYSVFEVVYRQADASRIAIERVIECPFEWFSIKPDGTLVWRDTQDAADPRKFFAVVSGGSLRKPHGEALLAKAYWPWFFRTHGWRFWAKFLEQAAVPLLYGKTLSDKQAMVEMLRTLTSGPVAAVDREDELIALDQPGNSPNKFTEFEIACVRRIQRLILGQTLTSGTDGGSGNRALGEVHDEVRQEKRRADIRLVSEAARRVLETLAALNAMTAPRLVMEDEIGLNRDRAERDEILVKAGMLRFTRRYLEEKYGLEPDDFEDVAADAAPQEDAAAATGSPTPSSANTAAAGLMTLAAKDGQGDDYSGPEDDPTPVSLMAGQLDREASGAWQRIMDTVRDIVQEADSLEALRDKLLAAYGDLPSDQLADVMTMAFAAAELAGRYHVLVDSK